MKTIMALLLSLSLLALGGCKKNQTVDAPPVDDPVSEPATVTDGGPVEVIDVGPVADDGYDYESDQASAAASSNRYEVRRGDTLWSIAMNVYGDGKRWRDIATANGIGDPKGLAVGQVLVIP